MGKPKKEKNLKLIDGKWYIDFTFNKKRIRQFGGYTKGQARNTLIKMKAEKLDEKRGYKKPAQPDIGFAEFAREFIEIYSKQNKKSWTRDEVSLKSLKPFFKGKTIQDIGPELIERYKAKRKTEVSPATVHVDTASVYILKFKGNTETSFCILGPRDKNFSKIGQKSPF